MPVIIKAIVLGKSILKLTRDLSIKNAIMSSNASIGSKSIGLESKSDSTPNIDNDSFGWNDAFSIEMPLSLRRALYGVVGIGIVINVFPKVKFHGMNILEASEEYMVRVTEILPFAKDLIVMLVQHDYLVLFDTINKTVLWRVQDMDFLLEDPSINVVGVET